MGGRGDAEVFEVSTSASFAYCRGRGSVKGTMVDETMSFAFVFRVTGASPWYRRAGSFEKRSARAAI